MAQVLSQNLFAVLAENGAQAPPEASSARKPEAKRTVPGAAPKKAPEADVSDNSRAKPNEHGLKRDYPRRGGANYIAPVTRGDNATIPRYNERREGVSRGGRGGRGRGGSRGGRGGRGREFDRHSGTGRHDGEKKEVAGKGSWGNPTNEEVVALESGEKVEGQDSVQVVSAAEGAAIKEALQAPEEPEEVVKTLDQFFAERAKNKAASSAAPRRANEGSDDTQWKDAVVLNRGEEEFYFAGKQQSKSSKKGGKSRSEKTFYNIEQRFNEPKYTNSRNYERGQKGQSRNQGVSLNDFNAFPELSK